MTKNKSDVFQVKLIERFQLTKDVYSFKFEKPACDWSEGTNIHLTFIEDRQAALLDKTKVRHLSIHNQIDQSYLGLTTRITAEASDFKKKLLALKIGDPVLIYQFASRIKLRRENRPLVFLTMGVALSPVKAMIEAYLDNRESISSITSLHISSPGYDYKDFLPEAYGIEKLHVHHREAFYRHLEQLYSPESVFYLIGSDAFLEDLIRYLHEKGHSKTLIELDKKVDKKQVLLEDFN